MSESVPIVGIDLGTTYSAAACIQKGRPQIIPAAGGQGIIPSVVHMDRSGRVIVGRDARAALVAMPNRTVAAIKRQMGSDKKVKLGDKEFLPQEISALILKELKDAVDNLLGPGEKEAVITVPAYFNDEQRRATQQAGELAGFVVERIINEPTAAAMAFGLYNMQENRNILVYDLGGGTFDVSVLETLGGILEVKASAGNSLLGGEDFDWLLVNWMAGILKERHGADPLKDLKAKALLKEEAERVKIVLSREEKATASLPVVMFHKNKPLGLEAEISRKEFEEMIEPLLQETLNKVRDALTEAGLEAENIQDVLLVGGSTRIPRVRELLYEIFQKEARKDVHPDEAVALGAAVQAGIKGGNISKDEMIVTDVAPFSMGIAVMDNSFGPNAREGRFSVIIPKNTAIPASRKDTFCTVGDYQTVASIEVYQGEHRWVENNKHLGKFSLEGVPPAPAGEEKIVVEFRYNLNGILEVTAKCLSNNKSMQVVMQDALSRFAREAFQESATSLEALWKNAPGEEEPQAQLDIDSYLDDEDFTVEDKDHQAMEEEARVLLKRAKKLKSAAIGLKRKKLLDIIDLLKGALEGNDSDNLAGAIDEATDLLIDVDV